MMRYTKWDETRTSRAVAHLVADSREVSQVHLCISTASCGIVDIGTRPCNASCMPGIFASEKGGAGATSVRMLYSARTGAPPDLPLESLRTWCTFSTTLRRTPFAHTGRFLTLGRGTHMSIVPARSELPLHSFPLDTQHPSFVPRKNMRRRLRAQIP